MNSADAWHEDADDLEALLGLSVELVDTMNAAQREVEMSQELEAAKQRHPSGKVVTDIPVPPDGVVFAVLNAADRCDQGCSAAALYRVAKAASELDFCHHHHAKFFPGMEATGWSVVGTNPSLMEELYGSGRNRLQGGDHA